MANINTLKRVVDLLQTTKKEFLILGDFKKQLRIHPYAVKESIDFLNELKLVNIKPAGRTIEVMWSGEK